MLDFVNNYSTIIILVLVVLLAGLSYCIYANFHHASNGRELATRVTQILQQGGCQIKGTQVSCGRGAPFDGLGSEFSVNDAVQKVIQLVSRDLRPSPGDVGGGSSPPYMPSQEPQPGGSRGPPAPIPTAMRRGVPVGGGGGGGGGGQGPRQQPPMGGGGGGGALLSSDGMAIGGSMVATGEDPTYSDR